MSIVYKAYQENDFEYVSGLMDKFQGYLVDLDPLKRLRIMSGYGEKKVAEMLEKVRTENGTVVVAVEGETIVGFIAGTVQQPTEVDLLERVPTVYGHVIELFVSESVRAKGIGKELMMRLEQYFKAAGCNEISIEVFEPNQGAYEFYKKMNYVDRSKELIKIIG